MSQNTIQCNVSMWQTFKLRSENINHLIELSLDKQTKKINEKYTSISNTVKILKNLMIQFSKKADNLQKKLFAVTRIEETSSQSQYYQMRIKQCQEFSYKLNKQIQEKKNKIQEKFAQVTNIKKDLLKYKLENMKLIMKMQEIQMSYKSEQQKQNIRIIKEQKKLKKQQQRKFLTTSPYNTYHTFKSSTGTNQNTQIFSQSSLKQQCNKLQMQLFRKIDMIKQRKQFIQNCYRLMREKLRKQQKKSNIYGLTGSMFFKLENKYQQQTALPQILGNKCQNIVIKSKCNKFNDAKLMVYDILKEKYRKSVKLENKKKEQLYITLEEFMKFSPMQIIGVIELKGGLNNILNLYQESGKEIQNSQKNQHNFQAVKQKQYQPSKTQQRSKQQNDIITNKTTPNFAQKQKQKINFKCF